MGQYSRRLVKEWLDASEKAEAVAAFLPITRARRHRTTMPGDDAAARPQDLVQRDFTAPAPNRLWVCDLTYVRTWSGFLTEAEAAYYSQDVPVMEVGSQGTESL